MDRFDVDYIDEEQGIKHIPCHDGDYVLAHEALATIEQLQAALTNLAKSPQGFDGYWKDYAMSELRRICPPGKDAT